MKTDKFEKTIRRKLESISPDFQEKDWVKMQQYMHANTPPSLWQKYGSWIGYAAAASVTTVMAMMYTNQLSQNNHLRSDVSQLQKQIENIRQQPAVAAAKPDTVYIIQKEIQTREVPVYRHTPDRLAEDDTEHPESEYAPKYRRNQTDAPGFAQAENTEAGENPVNVNNEAEEAVNEVANRATKPGNHRAESNRSSLAHSVTRRNDEISNASRWERVEPGNPTATTTKSRDLAVQPNNVTTPPSGREPAYTKVLGSEFSPLKEQLPVAMTTPETRMQEALSNRMTPKQIRKAWMTSTAVAYRNANPNTATTTNAAAKPEQSENVIPKLNLKVPYRFGVAWQTEDRAQVKSIVGEVLVSKKVSLSTGVSWMKIKPVEFFTEAIFRDKNRKDFKQMHPNQVPKAFKVMNIRIDPTIVQIPLTVAFRNDINESWAYYIGAGTNVTLKAKEKISYDCLVPNPANEFQAQQFENKMKIPVVNAINFSFGVEKSFHPFVVQAEGYIHSYFKPLTPFNQQTGPGFKVKLLYQIGKRL